MTRTQKVMLIGLIVLVLLFILVMARGLTQPACLDKPERATPCCRPGGGIKSLGKLTSPFASGLKLPKPSYAVAPGGSEVVSFPAASDKMRSVKVKLAQGSLAHLSLVNLLPDEDNDPDGMLKQRHIDRNPLPFPDDDHVMQQTMTLVVTERGGTLTMRCDGSSRCVFEGG